MSEEVVVPDGELTDEAYALTEKQFLSGELEKPVEEEVVEKAEEEKPEEEEEPEVSNEGPAIKESKRLREKNRELNDKYAEMEKKYADLASQVESLKKPKEEPAKKDPVKEASLEQLVETEIAIDEQLMEAFTQGDKEQAKKLSAMKQRVRLELVNRPKQQYEAEDEEKKANDEWNALEQEIVSHHPDIKDPNSDLQKQVQEFLKQRPNLTKKVGALAGLLAVASTVLLQGKNSKSNSTSSKNKDVLQELEDITRSSTKRSAGTTQPKHGKHIEMPDPDVDYDKAEEWFRKVRSGQIKLEGL